MSDAADLHKHLRSLDVFYLQQERRFRGLYDRARVTAGEALARGYAVFVSRLELLAPVTRPA